MCSSVDSSLGTASTVVPWMSCMRMMDPAFALPARLATIDGTRSRQSSVSTFHRICASPSRFVSAATRLSVEPYGGRIRVMRMPAILSTRSWVCLSW